MSGIGQNRFVKVKFVTFSHELQRKYHAVFFYIPDGLVVGLLFEGDLAGLGKVLLAKLLLFTEFTAPGSMLATFRWRLIFRYYKLAVYYFCKKILRGFLVQVPSDFLSVQKYLFNNKD